MSRPAALFFDLGKVLCDFDWVRSQRRLALQLGGSVSVESILAWLLGKDGPHDAYCRGELDESALLTTLHWRFDPGGKLDDEWLLYLWCDMFTPINGALELLDALQGQAFRGLISNTNRLHFEWLDHRMQLRRRFEGVSLSYEIGALKPDPSVFEHALALAGVKPEEAWYVDDIAEFTAAAAKLGMRTSTFEGIPALCSQLAEMGFDVETPRLPR